MSRAGWTAAAVAAMLAGCAAEPATTPAGDGGLRLYSAGGGVSAEYRQVFLARGVDPVWRGQVRPGEARIRIEGQAERVIRLRVS